MANSGFSFESATRFATNLEEEMEKLNPPGLALLRSKLGDEIDELKNAVTQSLQQNQAEPPLVFDSHAGDLGMVATMKVGTPPPPMKPQNRHAVRSIAHGLAGWPSTSGRM
eukprot:5882213-Prymnesium_polylepis.2